MESAKLYLIGQFGNEDLFKGGNKQDKTVKLSDNMTFNLISFEGKIEMDFDRALNSESNFTQFKSVCEGFGTAIK